MSAGACRYRSDGYESRGEHEEAVEVHAHEQPGVVSGRECQTRCLKGSMRRPVYIPISSRLSLSYSSGSWVGVLSPRTHAPNF